MKKENKKLAQQQRARERQKRERIRKVNVFLKYFIPCAAVAALIFAIVFDTVQRSKEEAAQAEAESTESESSDDTEFSTDSTLTVQDGDTVNIDYVGTVDGVEFDGGSTDGNGADLVIGSGTYIDDFEEQLIGSHPGDQVSVEVTFPDNYSSEELSGKDAVFEVTVKPCRRMSCGRAGSVKYLSGKRSALRSFRDCGILSVPSGYAPPDLRAC